MDRVNLDHQTLNAGYSKAGNPLKAKTNLSSAALLTRSANAAARTQSCRRGAVFYDTAGLRCRSCPRDAASKQHLRVPLFTGVWPLFSSRQAEFLHHEVPGIIVPDSVRAKLAVLDDNHERAYGMQVAEKIIAAALRYFPGLYLITPFLHYKATTELAKFAWSL